MMEFNNLMTGGNSRTRERGEVALNPAVLFQVLQGIVRVEHGRGVVLVPPGGWSGEWSLFEPAGKVLAHSDCEIRWWTPSQVRTLLWEKPAIGVYLAQLADARAAEALELWYWTAHDTVETTIMRWLLRTAQQIGVLQQPAEFELPHLTHTLVAAAVGCTREGVTRTLCDLRRNGAIQYDQKQMLVDVGKIQRLLPEIQASNKQAAA